jgi:hypothetical protein
MATLSQEIMEELERIFHDPNRGSGSFRRENPGKFGPPAGLRMVSYHNKGRGGPSDPWNLPCMPREGNAALFGQAGLL